MVLSWLLNSVDSNLGNSIIYSDLASDVWKDLKERFGQNNAPRLFQIKRNISSLNQEGSTVSVYYAKLQSFWDELSSLSSLPTCTCGAFKLINEKE